MNLPKFEIIVDDEITLRRLRLDSVKIIFKAIDTNRIYLRKWLPFVDQTKKEEDTEIFIKSIIHSTSPRKDLVYEIWLKKQFAGLIALKEIDSWNKKTELGYWLVQDLQGKGVATRSCKALIKHAFKDLDMNRMQLRIGIGNSKSSMIAERLNFKFEGIERAGEKHHDRFIDLEVYSLLKEEAAAIL